MSFDIHNCGYYRIVQVEWKEEKCWSQKDDSNEMQVSN